MLIGENERFLRLPEVSHLTGLSRSTIYEYISTGLFPKPILIGKRAVAWLLSDVNAYMEKRISLSLNNLASRLSSKHVSATPPAPPVHGTRRA